MDDGAQTGDGPQGSSRPARPWPWRLNGSLRADLKQRLKVVRTPDAEVIHYYNFLGRAVIKKEAPCEGLHACRDLVLCEE